MTRFYERVFFMLSTHLKQRYTKNIIQEIIITVSADNPNIIINGASNKITVQSDATINFGSESTTQENVIDDGVDFSATGDGAVNIPLPFEIFSRALGTAVAAAELLIEADYTAASWGPFASVLVEAQGELVEKALAEFIVLTDVNHGKLDGSALTFTVSYHSQAGYDTFGYIQLSGTISHPELTALELVMDGNQVSISAWIKAPVGAHSLTGGG